MRKRYIYAMLALAMCLSLCATVFAAPINPSVDEKKLYLENTCNIPKDFLDSAAENIILEMYAEATTNGMDVVSYGENFADMGHSGGLIRPASISSKDFRMTTLVTRTYDGTGKKFQYYTVFTNYEWLGKAPFWRLMDDGITVNWENSLLYYKANTFHCYSYYKTDTMKNWLEYDHTTRPDNVAQGGIGISFDLHNDCETYLKGTVRFQLGTDYYGRGKTVTINSNYAHTYLAVAPTMSFTTNGLGIGFGSTFGRDLCASSANLTL